MFFIYLITLWYSQQNHFVFDMYTEKRKSYLKFITFLFFDGAAWTFSQWFAEKISKMAAFYKSRHFTMLKSLRIKILPVFLSREFFSYETRFQVWNFTVNSISKIHTWKYHSLKNTKPEKNFTWKFENRLFLFRDVLFRKNQFGGKISRTNKWFDFFH